MMIYKMKLSSVHKYIEDIPNIGPSTRDELHRVLDTIERLKDELKIIDDVGDMYINSNLIIKKFEELDEDSNCDIELYLNILYDIPEIDRFLRDEGYIFNMHTYYHDIKSVQSNIFCMTLLNLACMVICIGSTFA